MRRGRKRRLVWLLAGAVAGALALGAAVRFVADLLWFAELGQADTFWRLVQARLAVRAGLATLYAAVFFVNLRIAARSFGSIRRRIANLEIHEAVKPLHLNLLAAAAALVLAFLFTAGVSGQWPRLLLFLHPSSFGVPDPVFGRDVGFYVFRLPLWRWLQTNLLVLLVLNLVLAAVVYLTSGALEVTSRHVAIKDRPRAHFAALLAGVFLVLAWGYRLDMLGLVHSSRGLVHGAGWTDVHARIPGYWGLVALALAAAGVAARESFRGGLGRVGLAALGLLAGSVLLRVLVPGLVQQFRVEPDEIAKETPYIAQNIRLTRRAFGLDAVERRPFAPSDELRAGALAARREEVESIRLWDWRPLLQTYAQLQAIRLYYGFADVDLDRYRIGGRKRQVTLAVRELRSGTLAEGARTWQNRHLVFTHGYGVVMSPVDEVSPEGLPTFFIRDIPPVVAARAAGPELAISRPEIYYGEETSEYAVVNTREREFDYPRGDANVYARYAGRGGVPLDAGWKRLLFAWRFGTLKLVLADAITSESRLMFHRRIGERVRRLAPFLVYDADPYPVLHEGRIVWIQDAYTVSDGYPYSEPAAFRGLAVNYVRNSVKAVVDAYDGSVTLYAFDEADPVLASYRRIFPSLFRPAAEMPPGLRAHVRYPEDLFAVQAGALRAYHMTDARVFYNKEDAWSLPSELYQETPQPMQPYYVVLRLPGETEPQFSLLLPFTPSGKDNMVALLAAKSDGEAYGELVLYELPKDQLIFGPMQVEARIDQDARISEQITLWSQKGSRVIRGNLLVLPLEGAILYVEPLFLQAEESRLPELKLVIAAYGPRIAVSETLEGTLAALAAGEGAAVAAATGAEERALGRTAGARTGATAAGPGGGSPEPAGRGGAAADTALPRRAVELYRAAVEAQRKGDWAAYGERWRELGRVLEELQRGP